MTGNKRTGLKNVYASNQYFVIEFKIIIFNHLVFVLQHLVATPNTNFWTIQRVNNMSIVLL